MKALGRGSLAAIIKTGLDVLTVILWACAAGLVIAGIAAALAWAGVLNREIWPVDRNSGVDPFAPQVAAPALLAGAVMIGGGLIIVRRLQRLFASFTSGEPFREENAGHLRIIWITLLIMEVSRYAIAALTAGLLAGLGLPEGANMRLALKVDLTNWAAIFVLIVLAEVFREGARLRREQDLTI